ncbi:MAG: amino acid adenylation domain-containing protein [Lachnospiraceae bacterium]|jgi:amino acid adenylation domain-containing protein|nr:amino acid adenylation domain-containing protein [Lachnospiraceae bacterium]
MQNNILDYMEDSCRDFPEKVAFSDGDYHLTFGDLKRLSDGIGTYLAVNGFHREPIIVLMPRHPDTVAAFLGIVRGGCFYVPIDVDMPRVRIDHILTNMNARLLICTKETEIAAREMTFDGQVILYESIKRTTADDTLLAAIAAKAIDTDPIYVVHTSGSTGVPKGVVACHRSVIDYIEQLSEVLRFAPDTIFGNQTPLYFDACLKEIYPTLKYGATTYLIPAKLFMQPVKLVEYLNNYRINTICWVVSAMTMISSLGTFQTIIPAFLSAINFGSEVFPPKEMAKWRKVLPHARFINLYGPTECTGMCCYYELKNPSADEDLAVIPIGRPFKNTEILILNEKDEPVTVGEMGELCVRGTSLTLGYYNDFARTNEVFIQNPLQRSYPELIYRTGDIGYQNEQGELVFCSRKDHQIKHMGHRIELGEIEASVHRIAEVGMACCVYDSEKRKIRLFYTGTLSSKEVTAKLKELLPRYMMPATVKQLETLPLTANGKVDRRLLGTE